MIHIGTLEYSQSTFPGEGMIICVTKRTPKSSICTRKHMVQGLYKISQFPQKKKSHIWRGPQQVITVQGIHSPPTEVWQQVHDSLDGGVGGPCQVRNGGSRVLSGGWLGSWLGMDQWNDVLFGQKNTFLGKG